MAVKHVILAGQSNATGYGLVADLPSRLLHPSTGTRIYATGEVAPARSGVLGVLDSGYGGSLDLVGPELALGVRLEALRPSDDWVIAKHTVPGTTLTVDWNPVTGSAYADMLTMVAAALAAAGGSVAGLVWMQGESDTLMRDDAEQYGAELRAFLTALKADLGLGAIPVVVGLVQWNAAWPFARQVRMGQVDSSVSLHATRIVETGDLTCRPADPHHFDAASQIVLGQRFAAALLDPQVGRRPCYG